MGRFEYSERSLVEDCIKFDADGALARGLGDLWALTESMAHTTSEDGLRVDCSMRKTSKRWVRIRFDVQRLQSSRVIGKESTDAVLMQRPCNFGGVRWFWVCPDCERFAKYLYAADGCQLVSCRSCLNLCYASNNANHHRPSGSSWSRLAFSFGQIESYQERKERRLENRRKRDARRIERTSALDVT